MHPYIRLISVIGIDACLGVIAFFSAFYLRLESFPETPLTIVLVVFLTIIFSYTVLGVYKGIWRYASINDLFIITKASFISVTITELFI